MNLVLSAKIVADGSVQLSWTGTGAGQAVQLLIQRTGAVASHTSFSLASGTDSYRIDHLSRHQRYLFCVVAQQEEKLLTSHWLSITPRMGLYPRAIKDDLLERQLARVEQLTLMPQENRLTAWWSLSPGFIDTVYMELWQDQERLAHVALEPEVHSFSLDASRGVDLENGQEYRVCLGTKFSGRTCAGPPQVACIPSLQGQERTANRDLDQSHLVYPTLSLADEVKIFDDDPTQSSTAADSRPGSKIICINCRGQVSWHSWRMRCEGCSAEFIPNGRGAYLDVGRLRFGTCSCCLPKKILIQKAGSKALVCAHSGKEHLPKPQGQGYTLIEDLPYGLCQCCRPRRPLVKKGNRVRCSKSDEIHRNESGRWAMVPSQPVFDASAIDALLDAGLAEISSTNVSSASNPSKKRRRR